ncbi:MAG: hypothetical protein EOP38_22805 [Rubrivivax sp.]|nr:MAG: hypothetical protein EOP38_22805 [Rubrivivax sp.]
MKWLVGVLLLSGLGACSCPPPARAQSPSGPPPSTAAHTAVPLEKNPMESPKRRVPQVAPVVLGNTRYEVVKGARSRGFAQNGGVIAAIDVPSGKELWTLMLYQTSYDAQEETDVQDRFITAMTLSPDQQHLLIQSENKKAYSVKLTDRSITIQP